MGNCYVFDIDGTLADLTHRLHYIKKTPKDWDGFFANVLGDAPIRHMVNLARQLGERTQLVFVSGRPNRTRSDTTQWLDRHRLVQFFRPSLFMRADGDRRDDTIVKAELLAKLRADGFEPIMAFDDRDRVVKMWRTHGIPCAQVAEGDF